MTDNTVSMDIEEAENKVFRVSRIMLDMHVGLRWSRLVRDRDVLGR